MTNHTSPQREAQKPSAFLSQGERASNPVRFYEFDRFRIDTKRHLLMRDGEPIAIKSKALDTLLLLVQHAGRLLEKEELMNRLWPDTAVEEANLTQNIFEVRKALGEVSGEQRFIATVARRGYRFVAEVGDDATAASQPIPMPARTTPEWTTQSPHRGRTRVTVVGGLIGVVMVTVFTWVWRGSPWPRSHVTLAVLPFENLSQRPEREYLADGLTEETVASLGQLDRVNVVGRRSTLRYKDSKKSLAEIGRELGVDYLVEGSIRAEGDRLRVTSRLVRVPDSVQVWSASYDRQPTSMLEVQQELSTAIAEQIRLRLSPERLAALARRQTRNADAYDLYLRGANFSRQRSPATNQRAIDYYEQAIALDPNYALAWSGIALTLSASTLNAYAVPREVLPRARDAAREAVRLAPDLAEAQLALGHVSWLGWDWPTAESSFRRAVALDPSSAQAHYLLGHALSQSGRHDEAKPLMARARALDPLDPMMHAMSAQVAYQAHDYAAVLEHARRAREIDPEFSIGSGQVAAAYYQLGKTGMALEALPKTNLAFRGYLLAKQGRAGEARDILRTLESLARDKYVQPSQLALVHAGLGDREAVFHWLDKAYAVQDVSLMFLPVDPRWDEYRADPRFEALMARCGFTRN